MIEQADDRPLRNKKAVDENHILHRGIFTPDVQKMQDKLKVKKADQKPARKDSSDEQLRGSSRNRKRS